MGIEVTEVAVREIKTIVQQQDLDNEKVRLRVGVKGGGCSGFSYLLDLAEQSNDEVFEQFGIKAVCDPKSYLYLNRTTIDFKNEIMGRGFVFNNPNATSTCGCSSSFSA